jgi:hypothetical protein
MTQSTAKTILIASMWICRVWIGPFVFWASVKNCHGFGNWRQIWSTFPKVVQYGTGANVLLLTFLNTAWTLVLTMRWFKGETVPDGQAVKETPIKSNGTKQRQRFVDGDQATLVAT